MNRYRTVLITLTAKQEKKVINDYIDQLSTITEKYIPGLPLIKVLKVLADRNLFHIKIVDRNNKDEKLSATYGYYSSFENDINLVLDSRAFQTKWFGMQPDYNVINVSEESLARFIYTSTHELMHFVCSNRFISYLNIWRNSFKEYINTFFNNIITYNFYDYLDSQSLHKFNQKKFMGSNVYKETVNKYINSITINMKFRLKSTLKRYNDIMSTLYSHTDFEYARFIDNILISALKLQDGIYNSYSYTIYNNLKNTYYQLEPTLKNTKMTSLCYQELFDFSEISCVYAGYYKYCPNHQEQIIRSLELIY